MRLKFILSGIICFVLILFLFPLLINTKASAENKNTSTTIAGIPISADKASSIQGEVAAAINEWKMQPLIVKGETAIIEIDPKHIEFAITNAVDAYIQAVKTPWYKPWSKEIATDIPLDVTLSDEVEEILKSAPLFIVDETMQAIVVHSSFLKKTEVHAKEISISKDSLPRTSFEIQEIRRDHGPILSPLAEALDASLVKPGETFSFLQFFDGHSLTDQEAVNFFASVLYSVVLQAEVSILERHSQHTLPNFLEPGIEVDVSERLHRDFVFRNDSQTPMIFASKIDNEKLLIELYTLESDRTITYVVHKKEVKPRTIYRLSSSVRRGTEKLLQEGESGYQVTVTKKIVDQTGTELEEHISRDFYPPKHKIVIVSSDEPVQIETNEVSEQEATNTEEKKESNSETNHEQTSEENRSTERDSEQNEIEESPPKEVMYDKGGNVITDQDD